MDNFDPDAYLATKAAAPSGGFDPDAYLASKDESLGGMAKSAGLGALNNFPMAKQVAAAIMPGQYSPNLANLTQEAAQAKKANPISYGTGAVAGTLAPLAFPGVGGALKAAPIAGNALYGAANAISDTDLLKHPGEALKQAGIGLGIGGATGALAQKLMPEAKTFTNYAERQAIPNVGINKGVLKGTEAETQDLGHFLTQNNLVGTDKAKLLEQAKLQQDAIGAKIGEIGQNAKDLGLSVDANTYQKSLTDLYGKHLQYSDTANKAAKALSRDYKNAATDILNKAPNGSWDELSKLKEIYGTTAFNDKHEILNQAHADAYFALKDMMKNISEKAQGMPNVPGDYKLALKQYHQIGDTVDGLEGLVSQERAGGQPHGGGAHGVARIIKSLPGQSNPAINLPTALATGMFLHPAAGLAVGLPTFTNPAVRSITATGLSKALPTATASTAEALDKYLTEKYGNSK